MAGNALSIGQKIDITRYYGNPFQQVGEEKSFASQLLEIRDELHIQVTMPMEGGKMVLLDVGERFNLYFYTVLGVYHCIAEVEGRSRTEQIYTVDLVFLSELERYQRRQFYRLNCVVDMAYETPEGVEREKLRSGIIIDISGGGVRFNSHKQFKLGDELVLYFRLQTKEETKDFALPSKVISSSPMKNKDVGYENRVEFKDISENDREDIVKYIFREERRRRKRERADR